MFSAEKIGLTGPRWRIPVSLFFVLSTQREKGEGLFSFQEDRAAPAEGSIQPLAMRVLPSETV